MKKNHPKHNVLSLRVTDEELRALQQLARMTNKNLSELMREALLSIAPPRERCDHHLYHMRGTHQ